MRRILVTGGAGYIGSHTLHALHAQGFAPACFDNLSTGHRVLAGPHPFSHGDLSRREDLDAAFLRHHPEAVVHFASHALVEESYRNPHKYYHDNILNALNLLEAMRRYEVPYLVFSSTCATYGIPSRVPIDETMPKDPVNPYGMTKLVIERMLHDYGNAYGIRHVSLRYFNAAGAAPDGSLGEWHVPETHLIPRLLEIARGNGTNAEIYGDDYPTPDGTCVRDYIHVMDLAQAHMQALAFLFAGGASDAFNLGTGQGGSVLEVVDAVRRITGREVPTVMKPRRPGDPPTLVANPSKARTLLQWQAEHSSIEEIVATAWNWRQGNICRTLAASE